MPQLSNFKKKLLKHLSAHNFTLVGLGLFVAWIGFLTFEKTALAYTYPETPQGFVSDFTGTLTPDQQNELESTLQNFSAETSNEISVVIIKTLNDDTIENFAAQLFEDYKIGSKKNDNGVLLLISLEDRAMRIEVGYGLEGAVTDLLAKRIIDNEIAPSFKAENYYAGIYNGVNALMKATKNEYTAGSGSESALPSSVVDIIFWFFIVFNVFGFWILGVLARSKSWWPGGFLGLFSGYFLLPLFVSASPNAKFILALIFGLFGLFIDYIISKTYKNSVKEGAKVPWWAGGNYSSSRSSSRGFGGFGGGRSGGGGASGGW